MVNFTNNDVLLYINNEMQALTASSFEKQLKSDWSLKEKYELLLEANNAIQIPLLKPSNRVINKILAYANESIAEKI